MKQWHIQYYGTGGFLHDYYTDAKTKEIALQNLRATGAKVIEIVCCRTIYYGSMNAQGGKYGC